MYKHDPFKFNTLIIDDPFIIDIKLQAGYMLLPRGTWLFLDFPA